MAEANKCRVFEEMNVFVLTTLVCLEHPPASLPLRRAGEARPHLQLHQVVHDVLDGRANAASTPPCQRVPGVRVGPTGLTCSLARAAGGGPTGGTCEAAGNPASRKGTCRANATSSPLENPYQIRVAPLVSEVLCGRAEYPEPLGVEASRVLQAARNRPIS